jgi:Rrf2 family nitric oxide-sensitive transcriptional repressor
MKLTSYTDYALRTLMFLASHPDRLVTIQDTAGMQSQSSCRLLGATGKMKACIR